MKSNYWNEAVHGDCPLIRVRVTRRTCLRLDGNLIETGKFSRSHRINPCLGKNVMKVPHGATHRMRHLDHGAQYKLNYYTQNNRNDHSSSINGTHRLMKSAYGCSVNRLNSYADVSQSHAMGSDTSQFSAFYRDERVERGRGSPACFPYCKSVC